MKARNNPSGGEKRVMIFFSLSPGSQRHPARSRGQRAKRRLLAFGMTFWRLLRKAPGRGLSSLDRASRDGGVLRSHSGGALALAAFPRPGQLRSSGRSAASARAAAAARSQEWGNLQLRLLGSLLALRKRPGLGCQ